MKDISSLVFPIYHNKEDVFYLRIFTFIYRTCDFREFILSNNNQILTDVPQIWKQKPKNRKQKQKTKKKNCQKWDLNPRPLSRTRT
jgi:hypothetical protein